MKQMENQLNALLSDRQAIRDNVTRLIDANAKFRERTRLYLTSRSKEIRLDVDATITRWRRERNAVNQQLQQLVRAVTQGRGQLDYLSRSHSDLLHTVTRVMPMEREMHSLRLSNMLNESREKTQLNESRSMWTTGS